MPARSCRAPGIPLAQCWYVALALAPPGSALHRTDLPKRGPARPSLNEVALALSKCGYADVPTADARHRRALRARSLSIALTDRRPQPM